MRQIDLAEVRPGMILARSILNSKGHFLLVSGVCLTSEYIRKLFILGITTLFIEDANYTDIIFPEYLSIETQQRALSVLSTTMEQVMQGQTFSSSAVFSIASDIVEELVTQADLTIHLTGISTHDDFTFSHSLNCSIYTALLARYCGFTIPQIKIIACGALLHDIGKTEVDHALLNKPAKLTDDEFSIIKQHPGDGFTILTKKRLEISSLVAHMAWQHHERIDGSGYPRGLKGDEILHYARLLAITDVYEAISVHRPYRKAMNPLAVYKTIHSGLGTDFDEEFGQNFLSHLSLFIPGTKVVLSTGEQAIVVSLTPNDPQKPVVRLITHPDGTPYLPPRNINLTENPEISIFTIVTKET